MRNPVFHSVLILLMIPLLTGGCRSAAQHNKLGIALYSQGETGKSISEYRKAIKLNPKFARAHSNLGLALEQQGKLDEAVAEYRKAIGLDLTIARYNLGLALKKKGKNREAAKQLNRFLKLADSSHKAEVKIARKTLKKLRAGNK